MLSRSRIPTPALVAAGVWAVLAGLPSCGSDEDGSGTQGSGGNAGSGVDGSSGTSGAGASSGGTGGTGTGNGVPDSVPCGTTTCTTVKSAECESSGGCHCCIGDSASTCNLYGHPCAGTILYCDGPEDCDVGEKCCGQFSTAPKGALCTIGCGAAADELCGSNADCSAGQVCTESPNLPSVKICLG